MQSLSPREVGSVRRARVACPRCGQRIELSGMRAHLRAFHQVGSAELETSFLSARKAARRATRPVRRE
jgi:hypothetical protein